MSFSGFLFQRIRRSRKRFHPALCALHDPAAALEIGLPFDRLGLFTPILMREPKPLRRGNGRRLCVLSHSSSEKTGLPKPHTPEAGNFTTEDLCGFYMVTLLALLVTIALFVIPSTVRLLIKWHPLYQWLSSQAS